MSDTLVESILTSAVKLALELLGGDRTKAILDAEYNAADMLVDEAERKKLTK